MTSRPVGLLSLGVAAALVLPQVPAYANVRMIHGEGQPRVLSRPGGFGDEPVGLGRPTTIAPGLTLRRFARPAPVLGHVLEADLTTATLRPAYLSAGVVTKRARLTRLARRAGAVAGVNGDFFDAGATDAPLGVGLTDNTLVHGPVTGWNRSAAFYADGEGTRARLTRVRLAGTITLPDGDTVETTNLNSPSVATDGIGIYTRRWGREDLDQVIAGAGRRETVVEVVVSEGVVTDIRSDPGRGVRPGTRVLLGVGDGAQALANVAVGDRVGVRYRRARRAVVAITGNVILLRDREVVAPDSRRQPRTAIGFSADGTRVWLVTIDGRSEASRGMSYLRLARLLRSLGAEDALNLDGGGSATMVARMPGDATVSVRNDPSEGTQRTVPNGIGFVTTARDRSR